MSAANDESSREAATSTVELEGLEQLCFVVRKSDGKFLRGARFWKWTGDWRRAALLTPSFVREYCLGKRYGIESMADVVLYSVQMHSNAGVTSLPHTKGD